MPAATLPSSVRGWIVALAAALVGLLAGFATVNLFAKLAGA